MTEVHMLEDSWATFGASFSLSCFFLQQTPEIASDDIDFK